jgi:hypothetical protein
MKILKIAEQEYESLKKLQRKVIVDTGSNLSHQQSQIPSSNPPLGGAFQGEIEAAAHIGEFQL